MANDESTLEWLIRLDREDAEKYFNYALYDLQRAQADKFPASAREWVRMARYNHEKALFHIARVADMRRNGCSKMKWEG